MRNIKIGQFKGVLNNIQDYFFPKNCLNCQKEGLWLCEDCKDGLHFMDCGACSFCGRITDLFCVCDRCQSIVRIRMVYSIFKYSDPLVQSIIKSFKYRYLEDIVLDLKPILRKFLHKYKNLITINDQTVLIPVPLYWYKSCERGFNQAEELAKVISQILDLSIESGLVIKNKLTKNQADVAHKDRCNNLKNSFILNGQAPKNAIIVDDVLTTGSTIREVARVLIEGGTQNIQIITLARG